MVHKSTWMRPECCWHVFEVPRFFFEVTEVRIAYFSRDSVWRDLFGGGGAGSCKNSSGTKNRFSLPGSPRRGFFFRKSCQILTWQGRNSPLVIVGQPGTTQGSTFCPAKDSKNIFTIGAFLVKILSERLQLKTHRLSKCQYSEQKKLSSLGQK